MCGSMCQICLYMSVIWWILCFQIIFLETICNDRKIIERNIRLKVQQSPDYAEEYGAKRFSYYFHTPYCQYVVICGIFQARF